MNNNGKDFPPPLEAWGSRKRAAFIRSGVLACLAFCSISIPSWCLAETSITDDSKNQVVLHKPARHIISLAPHITELLYAAGAGDYIIGVDSYSDFPPAVKSVTKVGRFDNFDVEKIVSLKPDLVVAWRSGNPRGLLQKLSSLGISVFVTEPRSINDVAQNIEKLGALAGTADIASAASRSLKTDYEELRRAYQNSEKITVFYQVWNQPLMTINGKHIISHVIELCGGVNVFSHLNRLAPTLDTESVIAANPQAIIASGTPGRPQWLDDWLKWPQIQAVKNKTLFHVHPDTINRHSPRILLGAKRICKQLDQVRKTIEN